MVCVLGTAPSESVRELHCSCKQESGNTGSVVKEEALGKLLFLFIFIQFLLGADYYVVLILVSQLKFYNL